MAMAKAMTMAMARSACHGRGGGAAVRRGRRGYSSEEMSGRRGCGAQRARVRSAVSSHVVGPATSPARLVVGHGRQTEGRWLASSSSPWSRVLWSLAALGCGTVGTMPSSEAEQVRETEAPPDDPALKNSEAMKKKKEACGAQTVEASRRLPSPRGNAPAERLLVSTAAVRGDRSHMEDTLVVSSCKRFAAVFDGHGGAAVSNYLQARLYPLLAPTLAKLDAQAAATSTTPMTKTERHGEIDRALREAVNQVDADVIARLSWRYQGSTAVGVLLYDDALFSINVGDSRAVLSRGGHAIDLTRDHKPNDPREQERIERLGGSVEWHGYVDARGEPIEPYGAYRVNGNLAVARAIGDRDSRPFVCGEVEIERRERDVGQDEFIVLASDGLWDVFTSEEAVSFVHDVLGGQVGGRESWRSGAHSDTKVPIFEWSHQYKSDRGLIQAARVRRKTQIANYLVQEALFRGTMDNVTVIVIWLK